MKKKKGPLILTGVLVILLIVYFGLSSWNKKQDKKEEKETVKVTDLDESTITAIKYQVAAGEMSFEKEGDIWYYLADNGQMQTGWITVDGKEYYMEENGHMAHDTTVDGKELGSNGAKIS